MKGSLVIEYSDTCKRISYQFEEPLSRYKEIDYKLWVTLPRGRDIDVTQIKLSLNKYLLRILNGKTYASNFPDRVAILAQAYSQDIDIFDSCDRVEIKGAKQEDIKQIFSHSTKKVIINDGIHPLELEEVEQLETKYAVYDNVYVYTDENEAPVSLEEYRITTEEITDIAERIKAYGLSPLEAAVYAYDYARDRLYVKEKSNDYTDSRDLSKVLLGDEVVCVGYARILDAILNKLGITSSLYNLRSVETGHAITIARIIDEKYDVDGVYYFDPTRDRKLDETNDHFNKYKAFAITRGEALGFGYYEDETFGPIDIDEYKRVARTLKTSKAHYSYIPTVCKNICNIMDFLDGKSVYNTTPVGSNQAIKDTPDVEEKLDLMFELLSTQIEPTKLLSAIARVRQIEYYENSEKFPLSSKTIKTIGKESQPYYSYYPYSKQKLERMYQDHGEEYDRAKEGIDLIKVLKKVKNQKEK